MPRRPFAPLLAVALLGCAAEVTAPPIAPPAPPRVAADRPIFYLTLEGERPPRRLRPRAIEADGRAVALEVPGGGATWSPDGQWIAYVANGTELRVMARDGAPRTVFRTEATTEGLLPRPAWSPDGRSIAMIVLSRRERGPFGHALTVVDVERGQARGRHALSPEVMRLPFHFTPPDKFRWSPDGRRVLVSWESAVIVEPATGRIEPVSQAAAVAEWAPRGDAVYYFEITGTEIGRTPRPDRGLGGFFVKRLGATAVTRVDGRALARAGLRASAPMHGVMTLSPTTRRLAVALLTAAGGGVRLYDVSTGEPPSLLQPAKEFTTEARVAALDWSPDERALAVLSVLNRDVRLHRLDLDSGTWTSLASWSLLSGPEFEVFTQKMLSWSQ